jgi:SAM-dependent methyltransferase
MTSYSEFAKFYDIAMGDMSGKIDFLQKLLKKSAPAAKTLLELACGTGTILEGLASSFDVSGVDLSEEMAGIAKEKLPNADIRVGDMTNYEFGRKFDVVLCVYDSINHLRTWEQWHALYTNAHKHLNSNGIFIFDFNTIKRLEWLSDNPPFGRLLGDDYMFMDVRSENGNFVWDIQVFEKEPDGHFVLHKDLIHETSFPVDQVINEASKLFTVEKIIDARGLDEESPNWRPFLVCRKS